MASAQTAKLRRNYEIFDAAAQYYIIASSFIVGGNKPPKECDKNN